MPVRRFGRVGVSVIGGRGTRRGRVSSVGMAVVVAAVVAVMARGTIVGMTVRIRVVVRMSMIVTA